MSRWSYTMQSFAFKTRIFALLKPQKTVVRIIERSVYTDRNVFAYNCYMSGLMTQLEWKIYTDWFQLMLSLREVKRAVKADGYIYLKASPKTSFKRIKERGRIEESNIKLKYLDRLSNLHDKMMNNTKTPVLILDCDIDFEHDSIAREEMMQKFLTFIK